jgi:type II secretory pathway pseudopilin PulG
MLSKKVWIIVGIGIIVVLIVFVLMTYFGQVREQQDLEDRLNSATARSVTLRAQKQDLEGQLSQAQALLDTSQAQYPQAIESIEYGEYIFEIAEKCNLSLASLTFPRPGTSTQGSVTYSAVSLSLPVSGGLEDIFEFIDTIKTDPRFASTSVNSVTLSPGGGGATISITIYSYKR